MRDPNLLAKLHFKKTGVLGVTGNAQILLIISFIFIIFFFPFRLQSWKKYWHNYEKRCCS